MIVWLLLIPYLIAGYYSIRIADWWLQKLFDFNNGVNSFKQEFPYAFLSMLIWPAFLPVSFMVDGIIYWSVKKNKAIKPAPEEKKVRIDLIKKVSKQQGLDQDPDYLAALEEIEAELDGRNSKYQIK